MHCIIRHVFMSLILCRISKKNAQALADLNIGHWVELTFFEGKLGGFFCGKDLKIYLWTKIKISSSPNPDLSVQRPCIFTLHLSVIILNVSCTQLWSTGRAIHKLTLRPPPVIAWWGPRSNLTIFHQIFKNKYLLEVNFPPQFMILKLSLSLSLSHLECSPSK